MEEIVSKRLRKRKAKKVELWCVNTAIPAAIYICSPQRHQLVGLFGNPSAAQVRTLLGRRYDYPLAKRQIRHPTEKELKTIYHWLPKRRWSLR